MDTNKVNSSTIITTSNNSKRSSLSSRASKIPQKLAQSTFFSLKSSASTLIHGSSGGGSGNEKDNNTTYNNNNYNNDNRLSTRIGHMLFRQRTTSESVIKESRSFSTEYSSQSLGRSNYQSRSLDIRKNDNTINNEMIDSNSLPTSVSHITKKKKKNH